jgi:hypothetical protein
MQEVLDIHHDDVELSDGDDSLDDPKIQYFKDAHRSGNKGKVRPSL